MSFSKKTISNSSRQKSVHFKARPIVRTIPSRMSSERLKKILSEKKNKENLRKIWSSKNPQKKFEKTIKKIASNSKK